MRVKVGNERLLISEMSGKLDGIYAINTSPLNNPFCQKSSKSKGTICESCYSIKALSSYRNNCDEPYQANGKLLGKRWDDAPFINVGILRGSGHGELINKAHFENLLDICDKNTHLTLSLWTKRKDIVQKVLKVRIKPSNLILIYSSPMIDKQAKLPDYFDKVFTVYSEDNQIINCSGKCIDCMKCYQHNNIKYINEVIK
jgi:hypothetical protein